MYVAGSDPRVKVASPSVGGSGYRTYARYGLLPQIRKVKGILNCSRTWVISLCSTHYSAITALGSE